MKSFMLLVVLLSLGAVVWCVKDLENARKLGAACMEENQSKLEVLQNFRQKKIEPSAIKPNEKCGMHCTLAKLGYINDAGVLDYAVAAEQYSVMKNKDVMLESLKACDKTHNDPNLCERSFQLILCMRDHLDW